MIWCDGASKDEKFEYQPGHWIAILLINSASSCYSMERCKYSQYCSFLISHCTL